MFDSSLLASSSNTLWTAKTIVRQSGSTQSMTIGSESGQVNVSSPKRIKLQTSGGASITIDDSGIKLVYPETIKIRAVKKGLVAGSKVSAPVIALPTSGLFSKAFDLKKLLPQDLIDQGISYRIINHTNGTEIKGRLDEDGQTLRVFSEKVELEIIGNVNHKGEIKTIEVSDQIECDNHSIENSFLDSDNDDSCGC
ncbi:hypothetical protein [Psychrobacter fozii]|uniref:hypothetical protein n=1 Tax=Psychrobacter fozii TaxID=198480 RepID=UPI001917D92F|nr:hypothetical protein [Psychrobacter fozii]